MSAYYNDPKFSYLAYWTTRQYEHDSEILALKKLLKNKHFDTAIDFGGGYGRLVPLLYDYADQVSLVEPSLKQRQFAKQFLKNFPQAKIKSGSAENPGLDPISQDLIVVVRVAHHLSDLAPMLTSFHQALTPKGLLILEFANSLNFKARLRGLIFGTTISRSPIDMRSPQNQNEQTIAFLNHHPETVFKTLQSRSFEVLRTLSVSNFRSPLLKRLIPLRLLLILENFAQALLSGLMFGPSIFVLARKLDKAKAP